MEIVRKEGVASIPPPSYFDIDPVIIRLLWVAFTLLFGIGLIVYVVAWILIPEEGEEENVEIDAC